MFIFYAVGVGDGVFKKENMRSQKCENDKQKTNKADNQKSNVWGFATMVVFE